MRAASDAQNLADEAIEVFDYMLTAPEVLIEESLHHGTAKPRAVTMFPAGLRMLPTTALPAR